MFAPSFAGGCLAGLGQAFPVWQGDLLPRAAVSKRKMCVYVCTSVLRRPRSVSLVSLILFVSCSVSVSLAYK